MLTSDAWQQSRRLHHKKYLALYHALRESLMANNGLAIEVPSERQIARRLSLSRGTVRLACEMLVADGFLIPEPGSGYLPGEGRDTRQKSGSPKPRLSQIARKIQAFHAGPEPLPAKAKYDLRAGGPENNGSSARAWKTAMHRALQETSWVDGSVLCDPAGWEPLRQSIAAHLRSRRGVNADPERLIITNGSGQALALLCLLLLREGDRVPVENPSYAGIRSMIGLAGGQPAPLPLDEEGMRVPDFRATLAFLSPTNQYPTGLTYSRRRRAALLSWAQECDAILVEDDYDAEFRRKGFPPEPLCASSDRVVYTGTFTRSMHRALRIGYILLPENLVKPMLHLKQTFEESPAGMIEQAALAAFMRSGAYDRHLRRMTRTLAKKHAILYEALTSGPNTPFRVYPSQCGLHIFAEWTGTAHSFARFQSSCSRHGLHFTMADRHFTGRHNPAVIFGFARIEGNHMNAAARVIRNHLA